jgi:uncharacterized protein YraI
MHDEPRRILRQLLILYGPDLHADPRRTEALLRDYCPTYSREIFVLVNAQKQRVPADLLAAPSWMPQAALHAQLARRLEEKFAFTPAAAAWAVDAWAEALHVGPNPPDRLWIWLKQHMPSPEAVRARRQSLRRWWTFQWRRSGKVGVQYKQSIASGRKRLRGLADQLALGWHRSLRLIRSPWVVASVAVVCALVTMASIQLDLRLPALPQPGPQRQLGPEHLAEHYPPPRAAWVQAGPLTVRSGPSTETTPLGLLAVAQEVRVRGYSPDGKWSQIEAPQAGWVNNRFLRFESAATPPQQTILWTAEAYIIGGPVNVRAGPGLEYPVLHSVTGTVPVSLIATDLSGSWSEIATPVHGWVRTDLLTLEQEGQ